MKNLDLLRAVAVLCVFTSHLVPTIFGFENIGSLGRFGVIIFFVHTSFVLMGSLERLADRGIDGWRVAFAFYVRRFFRIYPLAAAVVLLVPILKMPPVPLGAWHSFDFGVLVSNLALVQNLTHAPDVLGTLWSLPLEVQMYLILPLAWAAIRAGTFASPAMWFASVIAALFLYRTSPEIGLLSYAPCFMAGVLAYDLRRSSTARLPAWIFPIAVVGAILAFGPFDNISLPGKLPRAWGLSAVLAFAVAFTKDGALDFLHPAAHQISEYSYGIYLSHVPVLWFAFKVLGSWPAPVKFCLLAIGAIGIPVLLYRTIEKPSIAAGARLAERFVVVPFARIAATEASPQSAQ